jgi:ATP phosphoribosyltransferase regulatory subunit
MTAETAKRFEALEMQAQRLTGVFTAAGYELVAPAIIQPAGLFLDVVGENLRGRTYVFTDPDGAELCLRPDLTVPACRLYLEREPQARNPQRFCYNGPAFRFQPQDAPSANPREFRQAGIESFAANDSVAADAEVLALMVRAVTAAGLSTYELKLGDLGLFRALLDALALPRRWHDRLSHQFWRPDAFRTELKRLVSHPESAAEGIPKPLLAALNPDDPAGAEIIVAKHLEATGLEIMGTRTLPEITRGLLAAVADTRTGPLDPAKAAMIESYVRIAGQPNAAADALETMTRSGTVDITPALAAFRTRLAALEDAGIAVDRAQFSAEFGRKFEYYTGFVFEIIAPALGDKSPVAGGGRYDGLLEAIGAPRSVPAVGATIYTERLLAALTGNPGGAA